MRDAKTGRHPARRMLTITAVSYKVVPKTVASRRVADICYILEGTCECERCEFQVESRYHKPEAN